METLIEKINALYKELEELLDNTYDTREGDSDEMAEAKGNMYGDMTNLMLSIEWVLNEHKKATIMDDKRYILCYIDTTGHAVWESISGMDAMDERVFELSKELSCKPLDILVFDYDTEVYMDFRNAISK